MKLVVKMLMFLTPWLMMSSCALVSNHSDFSENLTHLDKDMYVIHATVYQVGILTNKNDNTTNSLANSTGNQESITLYNTHGTGIDLSAIPEPLLTNVTAQSLVGVAPFPQTNNNGNGSVKPTWDALKELTLPAAVHSLGNVSVAAGEQDLSNGLVNKRSLDNFYLRLFKRNTNDNVPVREENGTVMIPPEAGVHSIALPPLLSLNNNFSNIPVPIPNTSVVHYAKIYTLVQKPL